MIKQSLVTQLKGLTLFAALVSCLLVIVGFMMLSNVTNSTRLSTDVVTQSFKPLQRRHFKPTCNKTLFLQECRLDEDPPFIPRELLSKCRKVLYNRIPKTASTTFRHLFETLAPQKNMTNVFLHKPWMFSEEKRDRFVGHLRSSFGSAFILTSHYYFDSFTDVFGDTGIYIQVIREPNDWILSYLNWLKYGTQEAPRTRKLHTKTVEECIYEDGCIEARLNFAGSLVFICGQKKFCRLGTEESYEEAVYNIENHYLVVGLFEDLPAYVEVLEYLMPHVFSNITTLFASQGTSTYEVTKTRQKDDVNEAALETLKEKLHLHIKLYEFAKTRFYKLLAAVRKLKEMELN